jgi:hypothetical protein
MSKTAEEFLVSNSIFLLSEGNKVDPLGSAFFLCLKFCAKRNSSLEVLVRSVRVGFPFQETGTQEREIYCGFRVP